MCNSSYAASYSCSFPELYLEMPDQVGKVKIAGTRKWEEHKSSSPETAEPPAKLVRLIDNQVMASPSEAELETVVR